MIGSLNSHQTTAPDITSGQWRVNDIYATAQQKVLHDVIITLKITGFSSALESALRTPGWELLVMIVETFPVRNFGNITTEVPIILCRYPFRKTLGCSSPIYIGTDGVRFFVSLQEKQVQLSRCNRFQPNYCNSTVKGCLPFNFIASTQHVNTPEPTKLSE